MFFADKIIAACHEKQSRLVVGLDPHWDLIPQGLKDQFENSTAEILSQFLSQVVAKTLHYAVAFKPQIAMFERFGLTGLHVLAGLVARIHEMGGLVIMDAKRGDIGSTASAYADGFFGTAEIPSDWPSDALTVNGYLGSDGVKPFMGRDKHGIFVLVKTSNPSSGELQDLVLAEGGTVALRMARAVHGWNATSIGDSGYGNVGAVIGATYPEHMAALRREMPQSLILVPGYGAQGGSDDAVKAAFNADGLGALISASRSILFPPGLAAGNYTAVEAAAHEARDHIQGLL